MSRWLLDDTLLMIGGHIVLCHDKPLLAIMECNYKVMLDMDLSNIIDISRMNRHLFTDVAQ